MSSKNNSDRKKSKKKKKKKNVDSTFRIPDRIELYPWLQGEKGYREDKKFEVDVSSISVGNIKRIVARKFEELNLDNISFLVVNGEVLSEQMSLARILKKTKFCDEACVLAIEKNLDGRINVTMDYMLESYVCIVEDDISNEELKELFVSTFEDISSTENICLFCLSKVLDGDVTLGHLSATKGYLDLEVSCMKKPKNKTSSGHSVKFDAAGIPNYVTLSISYMKRPLENVEYMNVEDTMKKVCGFVKKKVDNGLKVENMTLLYRHLEITQSSLKKFFKEVMGDEEMKGLLTNDLRDLLVPLTLVKGYNGAF